MSFLPHPQVYNVTLGSLAATNEIFNVSIWFGNGKTRRLGWFPYSLYSFASNRLPTPRGGLLPPTNGANFTLATGWIGRCAPCTLPCLFFSLCRVLLCKAVWVPGWSTQSGTVGIVSWGAKLSSCRHRF